MKNKPFYHDQIIPLVKNNKIEKVVNYNKWIDDFIEREEQAYKWKVSSNNEKAAQPNVRAGLPRSSPRQPLNLTLALTI